MKRIPILLLALFCAASFTAFAAQKPNRPNIVVFLTDDHSALDLSPYGGREFHTPNMQRFADAGLTFTRAFVASPTCAPSRAALLTGMAPPRNGAEPNHSKPRPEIKKWPAYFQELGYEVVAFGKVAHYRHTEDYGFDYFAHDTFHDHAGIPAAIEFMEKRNPATAKPLCIFVGSNWPHVPWPEQPEGYEPAKLTLPAGSVDTPVTREWRARYATAVTKADTELGLVYDAARQAFGEETLFLFSADHGAQWPFAKWNVYEAGLHVPLMVVWPGVVKPGSRTDAMVSWIDFLPTLAEAAGGKPPRDIDGRSFLSVLRGKKKSHRNEIFGTHSGDGRWNIYPMRSVRDDRWKYILNLHPEFAFTTHIDLPGNLGQRAYFSTWEAAAQTNRHAAAIVERYHKRPAEELYDLASDPHEQRNLAADPKHASRLKKMRAQVERWMRDNNDQRVLAGPPRLLSEPDSYGPEGYPGNAPRKPAPQPKP